MSEGHDYVDAVAVGDGVLVRMSDNAAAALGHLIGELTGFLEREEVPAGHRRRWRTPRPNVVRRKMFPDVHASRGESDGFRNRFHETLTDTAPAHRVLARLNESMPFLVRFDELGDWHVTMSLVRALQKARPKPDPMIITWTLGVQEYLLLALDPQANNAWPR
ncbi:hypothetical protein PV646_31370 [Streptomyces sp. ID05-26A]|nr:hypothetical protein [Streptomyces sp. ID05-26A]